MSHSKIDKKLINQSEISRRMNCSQPYVNLILSGKRTGPKAQEKMQEIMKIVKSSHNAA